ncbi:MAG: Gfo/Idh/MocA family protein [Haloarculaceae archaeon]
MDGQDDRFVIGIVGLEAPGTYYADVFVDLGHEVVGVATDSDVREEFEREFDAETYEDPDDLFDADVDAVFISTPNKFHESLAVQAMEADHDVLVAKPLADSLESAEGIRDVAERTGNICMIGFYHRFREYYDVLQSYVDGGRLGEVIHVDARFVRRRGVPGRGTWYTSERLAGGGALIDLGSQVLDVLLALSEWRAIDEVMSATRSDFGHREDYSYVYMWGEDDEAKMYDVEDSARAFLQFEDGSTATVEVAWAANARNEHVYRIQGTEAGAELRIDNDPYRDSDPTDLELYEVREGGPDHLADTELVCENNEGHERMVETFVDAVRNDERPAKCNVHQGMAVQRAIERIYDADR